MQIETLYDIGDKVLTDGDKSIVGVVTAIRVYSQSYSTYRVEWFHNGSLNSAEVEEWRLDPWEE